jgi:GT2 family glycosyltransferase
MNQISFVTNCSLNTLDHVKLLIKSLKENLKGQRHEILIFVDSDNEGTVEWLREQKKDFYNLKIITHSLTPCVGYSRNNNLLVELAEHDIVSYLQSDMVISPNYDVDILSELEENCILSATRIEPPLHGKSYQTITEDFGTDPNEFKWEEFQKFSVGAKRDENLNYFFAPFTFYKKVWLDLGGYDTLFRRSREDSDLLQRFIQRGVKIKQTFEANVYHFSCVSSRGKNWFNPNSEEAQSRVKMQNIADRIELIRFTRKWGRFNHGEEKILRYDMDLLWTGGNIEDLVKIEYHFSKIWVPTQEIKDQLITFFNNRNEHQYANFLLKFSEEDWNNAKKFYNQIDYNTIIQVGEPEDYNIVIEVNMATDSIFLSNIGFLSELLKPYDPGVYQLGSTTYHIKNKINIGDSQAVVVNPPFDYTLLTIE